MKELHDILDGVVFEGEYYGVNNDAHRLYFTAPKEWLDEQYIAEGAKSTRIVLETYTDEHDKTRVRVMASPVFVNLFGVEYEPDWYTYRKIRNRRDK